MIEWKNSRKISYNIPPGAKESRGKNQRLSAAKLNAIDVFTINSALMYWYRKYGRIISQESLITDGKLC